MTTEDIVTDSTGRVGLAGVSYSIGEYAFYYEEDKHPVTGKTTPSLYYTGVFTEEGLDYLSQEENQTEKDFYIAMGKEQYCKGLILMGFSQQWRDAFQGYDPSKYNFMPAILKNKYGAVHKRYQTIYNYYANVIGIADDCFRECTYIKTNLPTSCKRAWENKGTDCIYIPPHVKYIGKKAFYGCTNIQGVLVGESISNNRMSGGELDLGGIGTDAFIMNDEKEHILYGPFDTKWSRYHSRIEKEYLDDLHIGD